MRPKIDPKVIARAFRVDRECPTKVPCPAPHASGFACEVCEDTGLVTVEVRAAYLADQKEKQSS